MLSLISYYACLLFSHCSTNVKLTYSFFEIYFHMRKNQQKNTTNKTMYKMQSKEKTKKEQNEIKERAAKMCSNVLTST